jgi:DNA-binding NarL/FixJ family response regulator
MSTLDRSLITLIKHRMDGQAAETTGLGLYYDLYEGLTEREALIVQLVSHGWEDREIAHELHSNLDQVKNDICQVLSQMSVESRAQLSQVLRCVEI